MTDMTILAGVQPGSTRDDEDEPGGPSHPAPGHLPPEPEPRRTPNDTTTSPADRRIQPLGMYPLRRQRLACVDRSR